MLLTNWPPYCLLGAGIVGLWLMQNAFSAGPLHSSLPTIAAGEPVAGIALGIVVFGDRIQISPGELAIEAGGIAALIVGVVMVARSSAFGGLRKITDIMPHPAHGEGSAHATDTRTAPGAARTTPGRTGARTSTACARARVDAASPLDEPAPLDTGPFDVGRPRRVHRRPFHGPASGEEGG